jgi:hypothetical protein
LVLGQALLGLSQLIAGSLLGQYFVLVRHFVRKRQLTPLRDKLLSGVSKMIVKEGEQGTAIYPK